MKVKESKKVFPFIIGLWVVLVIQIKLFKKLLRRGYEQQSSHLVLVRKIINHSIKVVIINPIHPL